MTFSFLGPDPVEQQIVALLNRIAAGERPSDIETPQVDCKEERGRRTADGSVLPGSVDNESAAAQLAEVMACFANTPGGGAVIVGIADVGTRIGTALDADWLRHRVYEITNRQLTVDVRVVDLDGVRLLVLKTHQAIEPIRVAGRISWRVDSHCVEVDPTTWHTHRLQHTGVDWSALPSGHGVNDVSASAIEIARRFLAEAAASGDAAARSLAEATDIDLIRRLNLVTDDDRLTNAGSLLFVATVDDGIDYIRRDTPGGDSTNRVRSRRPLIEQVHDVDQAINAANPITHTGQGLTKGQTRAIPPRAAREAVVNGVVHRDWLSGQPTTVEHTADMLVVTSPGGLPGGVRPDNIITHPSAPRYKSLAEAMAALRLAEREGVGIDRMIRDMLTVGLPRPEITELAGPTVRVSLIGGPPDPELVAFLADLTPTRTSEDLDIVLIVDHLTTHGFVDVATAQPLLQRPAGETQAAITRTTTTTLHNTPIITVINGVPPGNAPAYRLSDTAKQRLTGRVAHLGITPGRTRMILEWAYHRGRVSSTETADLTGLSIVRAGQILSELSESERLAPGRPQRTGRGFYWVPAGERT